MLSSQWRAGLGSGGKRAKSMRLQMVAVVGGLVCLNIWFAARCEGRSRLLFPDLAISSPRLRFHQGEIQNGQPKILLTLPNIPGLPSAWYVTQWLQSSYIGPKDLVINDPESVDPRLGAARYTFSAPDGHSYVRIYRDGSTSVYELYERNGSLTSTGGSNLFLSVDLSQQSVVFDHPIRYIIDAKITSASVLYFNGGAEASGAVLSHVFSGFGLTFSSSTTADSRFVFMQIPLSDSRTVGQRRGALMCALREGKPQLLYVPAMNKNEAMLPFRADPGPLHHMEYMLQDYLEQLVSQPFLCDGLKENWPAEARNLANWRISGLYVGLETNNVDTRNEMARNLEQGFVETGLQIGKLSLEQTDE